MNKKIKEPGNPKCLGDDNLTVEQAKEIASGNDVYLGDYFIFKGIKFYVISVNKNADTITLDLKNPYKWPPDIDYRHLLSRRWDWTGKAPS